MIYAEFTAMTAPPRQTATTLLASSNLISSGKDMALDFVGFLAILAIVLGAAVAIRKIKEGVGESITTQIGVIFLAVLIVLSVGIAEAFSQEAADRGVVKPQYYHKEWGR